MPSQDTLRLSDGTLIDTTTGKSTVNNEINRTFAQDTPRVRGRNTFVDGKRRFLDELPMPFIKSKPVAIIAGYTLFGLTPEDISRILTIDVDVICDILVSNDFARFMDCALQNIREHDTNVVRKKINKNAEKASDKVVELMDSKDEKIALAASKDTLDRAGHKPSDVVEHRMDGDFTIRVIRDSAKPAHVDVDMD